jgi:hypothetical protein
VRQSGREGRRQEGDLVMAGTHLCRHPSVHRRPTNPHLRCLASSCPPRGGPASAASTSHARKSAKNAASVSVTALGCASEAAALTWARAAPPPSATSAVSAPLVNAPRPDSPPRDRAACLVPGSGPPRHHGASASLSRGQVGNEPGPAPWRSVYRGRALLGHPPHLHATGSNP